MDQKRMMFASPFIFLSIISSDFQCSAAEKALLAHVKWPPRFFWGIHITTSLHIIPEPQDTLQ